MKQHPADSSEWTARYEQLRQNWLGQQRGEGQLLFLRSGMIAWLKYSSQTVTAKNRASCDASELDASESNPIAIRGDLQRQLTCELTNLILHRQQEVLA